MGVYQGDLTLGLEAHTRPGLGDWDGPEQGWLVGTPDYF